MLWERYRVAHHSVRMAALGVDVANTGISMASVIAEDSELTTHWRLKHIMYSVEMSLARSAAS